MQSDRPEDEALWQSLADVTGAFGVPAEHGAKVVSAFPGVDLKVVPQELKTAVAETLAFVYGLDSAAEQEAGKKR
jgi:type III secretion system FlhB-like substrate exporter